MSARFLPWAVAAFYLLFLFPSPEFPAYNADDASWFITMGLNLAEYGRFSTDTYPISAYGHHATWPPLFPSLLAGTIKVFGLNWIALKLLMVMFGLATLALLHRLWRGEAVGAWAVLLTALSPAFFLYSHHTMTETPYIAAVVAALIGLARVVDNRTAFFAGLLAVLAFFMRGYAVIFLIAGPVYFMLRPWPLRQRLVAGLTYVLPLLVAVLAWKGYTGQVIDSLPVDWITDRFGNGAGLLQSLLRPPVEYAQRLYWFELRYPAHFLLPLLPLEWVLRHDLAMALSLPLIALIAYGWLILFLRRRGAVECWFPLALAFLLVPPTGAARYLIPFLPFMFYYLLHGMREIASRMPGLNPAARKAPYVLLLLVSAAMVKHLVAPEDLRFVSEDCRNYRDIALWSASHLPGNAVVLAPKSHRFHAVSGIDTWPIDRIRQFPPAMREQMRPIYLLCTAESPAVQCASLVNPILRKGQLALYRIEP